MSTERIGIIADDLTGATDTAAAFTAAGFRAAVAIVPQGLEQYEVDVLCVTTNSRHDPPAEAVRKVRQACRALVKAGFPVRYKKLDSTAKGNILAEARAARDAAGFTRTLICPANPIQGRTVEEGCLWVRDREPVNLRERLSPQTSEAILWVHRPLGAARLKRLAAEPAGIWVCDATTPQDLAELVRLAEAQPQQILLTGSAGLATQLAAHLSQRRTPEKPKSQRGLRSSGRRLRGGPRQRSRSTLMVIGSNDPRTAGQLDVLTSRRPTLQLNPAADLPLNLPTALEEGRTVILRLPINRASPESIRTALKPLRRLLADGQFGSLLLSGGDTALLVCDWMKVKGIDLLGELLPGLAWGRTRDGLAPGLAVCTKPGGFGSDDALVLAAERLGQALGDPASRLAPGKRRGRADARPLCG